MACALNHQKNILLRLLLSLFAGAMLLTGGTTCQADSLTVSQRFWIADLDAVGTLDEEVWDGDISLKKDLGFQGASMGELRADWLLNRKSTLFASRFSGAFMGDATLKQTITWGGGLFTGEITHHISPSVELDYWKVGWAQRLCSFSGDKVRLSLLVDVKHADIGAQADISSHFMGATMNTFLAQKETFTGPTLGIAIDSRISPKVMIKSEISGIPGSLTDFSFMDWDTNLLMNLKRHGDVKAVVGYRVIAYKDKREQEVNSLTSVDLSGWVYGIHARF